MLQHWSQLVPNVNRHPRTWSSASSADKQQLLTRGTNTTVHDGGSFNHSVRSHFHTTPLSWRLLFFDAVHPWLLFLYVSCACRFTFSHCLTRVCQSANKQSKHTLQSTHSKRRLQNCSTEEQLWLSRHHCKMMVGGGGGGGGGNSKVWVQIKSINCCVSVPMQWTSKGTECLPETDIKQNPNNRSDSNTLQCNNKVTSVVYICTCAQPARKLNAFLKLTPQIKVNYIIFIIFLATVFWHWRWSVSQLWTLKQLGTPIKPNASYYPHLESITNGPKLPACKCTCRIVSGHNACMSVHIMPVCQCT